MKTEPRYNATVSREFKYDPLSPAAPRRVARTSRKLIHLDVLPKNFRRTGSGDLEQNLSPTTEVTNVMLCDFKSATEPYTRERRPLHVYYTYLYLMFDHRTITSYKCLMEKSCTQRESALNNAIGIADDYKNTKIRIPGPWVDEE